MKSSTPFVVWSLRATGFKSERAEVDDPIAIVYLVEAELVLASVVVDGSVDGSVDDSVEGSVDDSVEDSVDGSVDDSVDGSVDSSVVDLLNI